MFFCLVLWYPFKTKFENLERQTSLYILSLNSCLTNDYAAEAPSAGLFLGPIDEGCAVATAELQLLAATFVKCASDEIWIIYLRKGNHSATDLFLVQSSRHEYHACSFWGAENASKIEGSRVGNPKDIVVAGWTSRHLQRVPRSQCCRPPNISSRQIWVTWRLSLRSWCFLQHTCFGRATGMLAVATCP